MKDRLLKEVSFIFNCIMIAGVITILLYALYNHFITHQSLESIFTREKLDFYYMLIAGIVCWQIFYTQIEKQMKERSVDKKNEQLLTENVV